MLSLHLSHVNAIGKRKEDKRSKDLAARIRNVMGQLGVGEWTDYKSGVEDFQLAHPFLFSNGRHTSYPCCNLHSTDVATRMAEA